MTIPRFAWAIGLAGLLCSCISSRQVLTPEAAKVKYVEGDTEPSCELLGEISVGRAFFVFDERQPAKSHADVIVRMRRLAAKMNGNLVVIVENEAPSSNCTGYNGEGRVYRCSEEVLAGIEEPKPKDEASTGQPGS